MTEAIEIKLTNIELRNELKPREGLCRLDIVDEYRRNIADLPPILVGLDNGYYVLIDGWHRYRAHRDAKRDAIMAIVDFELKPEDFFFTAVRANKTHGIRFDAAEKKKISKRLFIDENRTAAEISEAVGCSIRHATDLVKEFAHAKKEMAIEIAKSLATTGYSQRDIAEELVKRGFKASKSSVDRWLKPEVEVPQIGESPKWAKPTVNDEPTTLVATELTPEDFEKLYCAKCKKDSKERTGKWYKITVDTVASSSCIDFMICSFCRRALGRWVRNE